LGSAVVLKKKDEFRINQIQINACLPSLCGGRLFVIKKFIKAVDFSALRW
jgi:hypothetical protein